LIKREYIIDWSHYFQIVILLCNTFTYIETTIIPKE
jgi:hypothetical protein